MKSPGVGFGDRFNAINFNAINFYENGVLEERESESGWLLAEVVFWRRIRCCREFM